MSERKKGQIELMKASSDHKERQTDFIGSSLQYIDSLCSLNHYHIAQAVADTLSKSDDPQADVLSLLANARICARSDPHRAHELLSEQNLRNMSSKALGDAYLLRGYAFLELGELVAMYKEIIQAKLHGTTLEIPQISLSTSNESQNQEHLN